MDKNSIIVLVSNCGIGFPKKTGTIGFAFESWYEVKILRTCLIIANFDFRQASLQTSTRSPDKTVLIFFIGWELS